MPRSTVSSRHLPARALPLTLLLAGCFGLSAEEETQLVLHEQNSKAYYDEGDLVRAEQQVRQGLELDSDHRTLRLTLAYIQLRRGDVQSLREADEILSDIEGWFGSDDFRVVMGRAIVQQQLGRLAAEDSDAEAAVEHREQARELFDEVLELEPDCIEAWYQLSTLDLAEEDEQRFARDTKKALSLIESSIQTKDMLLERTEQESARTAILRERTTQARRARALLRSLSELAFQGERYDEAVQHLDRMQAFLDLSREDYFNRATALSQGGELQRAVEDYDRFIQLSPKVDKQVETAIEQIQVLRARLAERRMNSEIGGGVGRG